MKLVLVHGIWDTGSIFRRLEAHLAAQGHDCFCPDLQPSNAANGLVDLAEKLRNRIDSTLPASETFAIVGFSMGVLVSRHYLQFLGGVERCSLFFSISGPNHGTLTAHLWPGKGPRDMRFGSSFLRALNADTSSVRGIELHNYRTPFDHMIIPSRSSKWAHGKEHVIPALTHDRMLVDPRLIHHISSVLQKREPE